MIKGEPETADKHGVESRTPASELRQRRGPGSILALGTAHWGQPYGIGHQRGQTDVATLTELLETAKTHGIDCVDTAQAYGTAEAVVGSLVGPCTRIVTKLPPGIRPEAIIPAIRKSCQTLGRARLDDILLHRAEDASPETSRILSQMRAEGHVKRTGVSVYDVEEVEVCRRSGLPVDIVQIPASILDQRLLRSGCLDRWEAEGVEIHCRSLFLQGLLLIEAESRPASIPDPTCILPQFDAWCGQQSRLARALSIISLMPGVTRWVLGVRGSGELEAILRTLSDPLPPPTPAELEHLDAGASPLVRPDQWPAP